MSTDPEEWPVSRYPRIDPGVFQCLPNELYSNLGYHRLKAMEFQFHPSLPYNFIRMREHFKDLQTAFQLHYYISLKTRYRQPLFDSEEVHAHVKATLEDTCRRHQLHLLDVQVSEDHLRILLSLRPEQTVANAVKLLKGNISRQFNLTFSTYRTGVRTGSPLAEGYYARSSAKADLDVVRRYVKSQVSHHGYRGTWTK